LFSFRIFFLDSVCSILNHCRRFIKNLTYKADFPAYENLIKKTFNGFKSEKFPRPPLPPPFRHMGFGILVIQKFHPLLGGSPNCLKHATGNYVFTGMARLYLRNVDTG
jgi:hypothetical protein